MTKPITDLEARLDAVFKRSEAARLMGKLGGSAKTTAKQEAARRNGKKGGRPLKVKVLQPK